MHRKKDDFDVRVCINSGLLTYGFVPCNPDCKEAYRILNDLKKITRGLEE